MYPIGNCKDGKGYCKAWDGNGSNYDGNRNLLPGNTCPTNREPSTCEFKCKSIKREGVDWVYRTIAGRPQNG